LSVVSVIGTIMERNLQLQTCDPPVFPSRAVEFYRFSPGSTAPEMISEAVADWC
jgi:hypothetical protein